MTKTVKEQVKETFKTKPFTEAWDATIEGREKLQHIMSRTNIYRMCVETSKYYGKYNIQK